IDEEQLPRIAALVGPDTKISPVIESSAVVASTHEVVSVLGVDILEDSPFRDTKVSGAPSTRDFLLLLSDPHSLIVGEAFATRNKLQVGSTIALLLNDHQADYTVRGVLAFEGAGKALEGNLVLMDIAAAQLAFGRLGKLDRIDLIVPPEKLNALEASLSAT